jgi:hypothetical protein
VAGVTWTAAYLEFRLRVQASVITRQQALECGLTAGQIRSRLSRGSWRPAFAGRHGVYVVDWGNAPLTYMQRIWAALLAVGGAAAASHETATWLAREAGLAPPLVHLALLDGARPPVIEGVKIHTLPSLGPEVVDQARVPWRVLPELAVIDIAHACSDSRAALGVVYAALQNYIATAAELEQALARRKRHRYRKLLTSVLADAVEGALSGLEREHLRCMRRHALPCGERQRKIPGPKGARFVDVMVSKGLTSPLVTELDGRRGHDLADEQWRDMDRDNLDEEMGRGHLRYGAAQVFGEGCRVAGQTRRALERRGWSGQAKRCGPGGTGLNPVNLPDQLQRLPANNKTCS